MNKVFDEWKLSYDSLDEAFKIIELAKKLGYDASKVDIIANWKITPNGIYCLESNGNIEYGIIYCKYYVVPAFKFFDWAEWKLSQQIDDKKVYYRGDLKRGKEIIKALQKLGGVKYKHWVDNVMEGNDPECLYYIGEGGWIVCTLATSKTGWLLQKAFTERLLPDNRETIIIGDATYDKIAFEEATKNLKRI